MAIMTVKGDAPGDPGQLKPIPQDTWVEVEVSGFEYNKLKPWKDKKTGADVRRNEWKFVVIDPPEYDGRIIFQDTIVEIGRNPLNLNFQWSLILLGLTDFPVDFQLDTDTLIGKRARALVREEHYTKANNVPAWANRIDELMPSRYTGSAGPRIIEASRQVPASMFNADEEPF